MDTGRVLTIRTPEGVAFTLPLAGPVRRGLAAAIDSMIAVTVSAVGWDIFVRRANLPPAVAGAVLLVIYSLGMTAVSIALEWRWRGRTLGKFLLGIRVMDAQGLRLRFDQILLRNVFRTVDSLPVFYGVGGLVMVLNRRSQRLGDIASNTVVVADRTARLNAIRGLTAVKYNSLLAYPHLVARLRQRVDPEAAAATATAILRRDEMEPQARVALFGELAEYYRGLVTFPEEAVFGLADEAYVRNAAACLYDGDAARTGNGGAAVSRTASTSAQ